MGWSPGNQNKQSFGETWCPGYLSGAFLGQYLWNIIPSNPTETENPGS